MSVPEHLLADVETRSKADSAPNLISGATRVKETGISITEKDRADLLKIKTTREGKQLTHDPDIAADRRNIGLSKRDAVENESLTRAVDTDPKIVF